MTDTHVILPRPRIVRLGEQYNGDSAVASFGTTPAGNVLAVGQPETFLYHAKWFSGSVTGYVAAQCGASFNVGWRMLQFNPGDNRPALAYRDTTGTQDSTSIKGTVDLTSKVCHVAFTFDGTAGNNGAFCYVGLNGAPLVDVSERTGTVGGTQQAISGELCIGNRSTTPAARSFSDGVIYYVARWNRMLSLAELRKAQAKGPLAVPNGLILCWSNGVDYGPYGLRPSTYTPTSKIAPLRSFPLSN